MTIDFWIPGTPVGQGRPRFARRGRFVSTYDPKKSKGWKRDASDAIVIAIKEQLGAWPLPLFGRGAAVSVRIEAVFPMPKAECQRDGLRRWRPRPELPDADNVMKALFDASTGTVWADDSMVVHVEMWKINGAQGEESGVRMHVTDVLPVLARG